MKIIKKADAPRLSDIKNFLNDVNFNLPNGFIEFFTQANEATLQGEEGFIILWPLTEMIQLNADYNVHQYAPDFFFFGSDGGDTAYCIEKKSGYIYDMPFIGMSNKDANFRYKTFFELLESK